jgi:hypothetical protein
MMPNPRLNPNTVLSAIDRIRLRERRRRRAATPATNA